MEKEPFNCTVDVYGSEKFLCPRHGPRVSEGEGNSFLYILEVGHVILLLLYGVLGGATVRARIVVLKLW